MDTVVNREDPFDFSSWIGAEVTCVTFSVNTVHVHIERTPGAVDALTILNEYALSERGREVEREKIPPRRSMLMTVAGRAVVKATLADSGYLVIDLGDEVRLTCFGMPDGRFEAFTVERPGEGVWAFF